MQEADQNAERVSIAVLSVPVQGIEEKPVQGIDEELEEAAPLKHIAKELFPTGDPSSRSGIRSQSQLCLGMRPEAAGCS